MANINYEDLPSEDTPLRALNINELVGTEMVADAYDSSKYYYKGDCCINNNKLYKCKNNHNGGTFDLTNWEETSILNVIKRKNLMDDPTWSNPRIIFGPSLFAYNFIEVYAKDGAGQQLYKKLPIYGRGFYFTLVSEKIETSNGVDYLTEDVSTFYLSEYSIELSKSAFTQRTNGSNPTTITTSTTTSEIIIYKVVGWKI